jgi:hypothetical protein
MYQSFNTWLEASQTLPPIDEDEYPDRSKEGLEGPFRFKDGRILYYDPKEGKYYDSKTDMYAYDNPM